MTNEEIETALRSMASILERVAETTAGFLDSGVDGPYEAPFRAEQKTKARSLREDVATMRRLLSPMQSNQS